MHMCFYSANQLTDDYCDVLVWPAYERRHEWWTVCKHCFMTFKFQLYFVCITANTEVFRWKFPDLFEDVCPLNMCFSLHSIWLLCCIMPSESSGRFYCATRYFRFRFRPYGHHRHVIRHRLTNFIRITQQLMKLWRHVDLQDGGYGVTNLLSVSVLVTYRITSKSIRILNFAKMTQSTADFYYYFWFLETNGRQIEVLHCASKKFPPLNSL